MDIQEMINSYDRQTNFIREQILKGNYSLAVDAANLLATWLRCKLDQVDADTKEGDTNQ